MIYFYYGTDAESARKKAKITVDSLIAKKPEASIVKIGDEDITEGQILELASGQGLFSSKYIVYVYKTFDNKGEISIKRVAVSVTLFNLW